MELTIDSWTHRRLLLPVRRWTTARGTVDRRPVVVVRMVCTVDGREVVGRGEAAPLEAWGTESAAEVDELLEAMHPPERSVAVRRIDALDPALADAPATRFALQTAALDAVARSRGEPLATLLGKSGYERTVPVNASLGLEADRRAVRESLAGGVRCVKLKVGAGEPRRAWERVTAVRRWLPDHVDLRVDANGSWTRRRARRFLREIADEGIAYVEQSVAADDREGLEELAAGSPVPVAADESAHPAERAREMLTGGVPVLVLKPAALGGLLCAVELADRAARCGKRVVWSSAIESAIGRAALLHLAAVCGDGPHGLATGEWLAADICSEFPVVDRGALAVPSGPGLGIEVDEASLRALAADTDDDSGGAR